MGIAEKQDIISTEKIDVYPNPSKDIITIQTNIANITGYQLSDLYGKVVKKAAFTPIKNNTFSIQNLQKGIYLLIIQLDNETQHTKTIIKN